MIDKIRQKIQDNKIYVLAAVFGVSALGAYLYFKSKSHTPTPDPPPKTQELAASTKDIKDDEQQSNEEKALVRVINRLKKILTGDSISYEAVKEIYKSQYELSREQFRVAILANRRARRKLLNNIKEYEKVYVKYEGEVQEIHNKHLNAVLAHFRIDKGGWMELTEGAAAQFSEEWGELLLSTEEEELESIREKNKPKLKLSALIEIEKYRLKVLKESIEEFKQSFKELDNSDLYNVAEKWATDHVYVKFMVEEEDLIYSRAQLSEDEKEELLKYEEDVQNIMEELICNEPGSESQDNEPNQP